MRQLSRSKSAAKLFSPAAIALAVGLMCWGSAAVVAASMNMYNGDVNLTVDAEVDFFIEKNAGGGFVASGKTFGGGNYQLHNIAPGSYNLCTKGQPCKTVFVGPDRTLRGQIRIQALHKQ